MISLICGICKKKKKKKKIQMNLFTQKKQTHRHRRQTNSFKGEMKGRNKLEVWGLKYTYYHIENR